MTPAALTPAQLFERRLYNTVAYKTFTVLLWANQQTVAGVLNYRYYWPTDATIDRSIITSIEVNAGFNGGTGDYATGLPSGGGYNVEYLLPSELPSFCLTLVDHDGNHVWENQPLASLYYENTGHYKKRLYNRIKADQCYITAYDSFSILNPPPQYERRAVITIGYIPPKY